MSQSRSSSTKRPNGRPFSNPSHLPGFSGKRDILGPGRSRAEKYRDTRNHAQGLKRKASSSSPVPLEADATRPNKKPKDVAKSGLGVGSAAASSVKQEAENDSVALKEPPFVNVAQSKPSDDVSIEKTQFEHPELVNTPTRLATLTDLPVELIIEIHELSSSSALPLVNRFTHACLSKPTTRQAIRWLEGKYPGWSIKPLSRIVEGALRHPFCNVPLLIEIIRLWQASNNSTALPPWFGILSVPVRVFRALVPSGAQVHTSPSSSDYTPTTPHHPPELDIINYLLDQGFELDRKAHKQGLRYAVFAGNLDLVRRFVEDGAEVLSGDRYELEVVARRNNLNMLKVLLETRAQSHEHRNMMRDAPSPTPELPNLQQSDLDFIAKWANQEMLQYLEEKWGLRPSLKSILAL